MNCPACGVELAEGAAFDEARSSDGDAAAQIGLSQRRELPDGWEFAPALTAS